MSTENPDLFGKIDALLGKRVPDALLEKELDIEDFPLLTEVVDSIPDALSGCDRRLRERRLADRRQEDSRMEGEAPAERAPALTAGMSDEMERLVAAMEQRLADIFIRQQLRIEDAVRRAIRDELGKDPDVQP
jgi:hypothetical protein